MSNPYPFQMKSRKVLPLPTNPFPNLSNDFSILSEMERSLTFVAEWEGSKQQAHVNLIVNHCKALLRLLDVIRVKLNDADSLEAKNRQLSHKVAQQQATISNMERVWSERVKAAIEEGRAAKEQMERNKRLIADFEEQGKAALATLRQENMQLKQMAIKQSKEKDKIVAQKEQLEKKLVSIELELYRFKEASKMSISNTSSILAKLDEYKKLRYSLVGLHCPNTPASTLRAHLPTLEEVFTDNRLNSLILSYLSPKDTLTVMQVNRQLWIIISKNWGSVKSLCLSLVRLKEIKINHYHRHINYFAERANKIPQEIVQSAYYEFYIEKKTIGTDMMGILSACSQVFDGRLIEEDEWYLSGGGNSNSRKPQDSPSKSNISTEVILSPLQKSVLKGEPLDPSEIVGHYLEVDPSIIRQSIHEQSIRHIKTQKELDSLQKKITSTVQLYSADIESTTQFYRCVLRKFVQLFVLSKGMYAEARSLQSLNTFLLSELVNWDKSKADLVSIIQDLRAQLDSERALKLFFTNKSVISEQKALAQEGHRLSLEVKHKKLIQSYNTACAESQQLNTKLKGVNDSLTIVTNDHRQLKKAHDFFRDKHKKIVQQLAVVRQTVMRMNL